MNTAHCCVVLSYAGIVIGNRAFQFGQKKVSIRFDSRYRIDFFDSIRFGNLVNLSLVH